MRLHEPWIRIPHLEGDDTYNVVPLPRLNSLSSELPQLEPHKVWFLEIPAWPAIDCLIVRRYLASSGISVGVCK